MYYTPPSEEIFQEVKRQAIEVWIETNSVPMYTDEKIAKVIDIANIEDNFMYMVAMFDSKNQMKLAKKLSAEARQAIRERMIDGGNPQHLIAF